MKIAWVSSYERICGIADYTKALLPELELQAESRGDLVKLYSLDAYPDLSSLASDLVRDEPDLIHFQHEYGLYGGKNPPLYYFPVFVKRLKQALPKTCMVATAHTILKPKYRYPISGRGLQIPLRMFANVFLLPFLRRLWGRQTWGKLKGIIVHSRYQKDWVRFNTSQKIAVIPHFVPEISDEPFALNLNQNSPFHVLVFGFFTPEKGQDIAIEAMRYLPEDVRLTLAGGTRRGADQKYFKECQGLIDQHGLRSRVEITGYVPESELDDLYKRADVVLAPFAETSGSGSLVQALGRLKPVLASDLELNREIEERIPGVLRFFSSGDPESCAKEIQHLRNEPRMRLELTRNARKYAGLYSPKAVVEKIFRFYEECRA